MSKYNPTLDSDFSFFTAVLDDSGQLIDHTTNALRYYTKTEDCNVSNEFIAVHNPFYGVVGHPLEFMEPKHTHIENALVDGVETPLVVVDVPSNQFDKGGYIYLKAETFLINPNYEDGVQNVVSDYKLQNTKYI